MKFVIQNPEFQQRKQESDRIKSKYPDRLPVICEKSPACTKKSIKQSKYLVPLDMSVYHFNHMIRQKRDMREDESLYMFANDMYLLRGDNIFSTIYSQYHNADGFLYITYSTEATFGTQ